MNILIYGLNFAPELTGIGKYTGEMTSWLAARGHEVRVVTAPPYYPQWRVADGWSGGAYGRERGGKHAMAALVFRCPLWVPQRPNGIRRIVHLGSFAVSSAPVVLGQIGWHPHLVVTVIPALFCAPAGLLAARLSKAKAWLHIQDFEADAAFSLGMMPGALAQVARAAEKTLLGCFDRVSTISEKMLERLAQKGVPDSRRFLFLNWVDVRAIHPLKRPSVLRSELGLPPGSVVTLYAGNLGEKQGLEVLMEAARLTAKKPSLYWVIAGDGSARDRLYAASQGLSNVKWLPLQPRERLNELLNLADIHVLPQRADAADLVMPSKLSGMLASGRPVVATAAAGTQIAKALGDCGICVAPGDAEALAGAVLRLSEKADERESLGKKAREYAEKKLDHDAVMSRFEREATALVFGKRLDAWGEG